MKAIDIINQLNVLIPQLTNKFTDEFSVSSLTRAGLVMTATTTTKHGLKVGEAISITGSIVPIIISSLTRSGVIGTLVTANAHDLTNAIAKTITIQGAAEAIFNGTFTRLNIDSKTKITFTMVDSGATTATGSPLLMNAESLLRNYNTSYAVATVPTDTTFTFAQTVAGLADPLGTILCRVKPKISGAVDVDRIIQAYSKQETNKYWMMVVLGDVNASKARDIRSDGVANIQRGNTFRQQIIQPFAVYVLMPTHEELGARVSRDEAEVLFQSITQSLLFHQFDGQLTGAKQGPVQFVQHSTFTYDTAVYMHVYNFEQTVDLTFDDTVGADLDVAFRCIDFKMFPDLGDTGFLQTLGINLDDE